MKLSRFYIIEIKSDYHFNLLSLRFWGSDYRMVEKGRKRTITLLTVARETRRPNIHINHIRSNEKIGCTLITLIHTRGWKYSYLEIKPLYESTASSISIPYKLIYNIHISHMNIMNIPSCLYKL